MRFLVLIAQITLGVVATPLAINKGLRSAINLASGNDFNRAYQLHFAVGHFGTYVTAVILALVFWLTGWILARVIGAARRPSIVTLLLTIASALGFAHLSQTPLVEPFETAVYSALYQSVPPIAYPLVGALLAAILFPGKRKA